MNKRFLRRRHVLIRPSSQIRIALNFFVYMAVYSLILGFVIFFPLYMDLHGATGIEERARLSSIVIYLHKRVWPGLFLVSVLAGIHAIYTTHRLVGPIVRFEDMVKSLAGGDFGTRIRIRKDDEFKDMAELLNSLASTLEEGELGLEGFHSEIRAKLKSVSDSLARDREKYPHKLRASIDELVKSINTRIGER